MLLSGRVRCKDDGALPMIVALAGRVIGPAATLLLLAYLAGFPPAYTAQYAVLAAYMQLATAPLNPYTEHFQLRELLSGRHGGFGAGLAGLALLWLASAVLVLALGQNPVILAVVPLLGFGHLMLKMLAARLRANRRNGLAIALEFSLRPVTLLALTGVIFILLGPSAQGLDWVFGLTGLITIAVAISMFVLVASSRAVPESSDNSDPPTARTSPWAFVLLGMMMVLANQFEVFTLDRLATDQALATYKVALQLASVCGIATNFILINNLRELYAHPTSSESYRKIFRMVRLKALTVSSIFALAFGTVALVWPAIWGREVWLLAAGSATIFAISSSFGPLNNWFYSVGRISAIIASLLLMLVIKVSLVALLAITDAVGAVTLMAVYALCVLAQNLFLFVLRARSEE